MIRLSQSAPTKLALVIGALSLPFWLQVQAQEADSYQLEEVIVTSQKRAESLQDVPLSVSTVTGEKLAEAGIENLEDLTAYLPNIHFTESGFSTQVRVRGIGSDNSQGFEQSVGMYIDDIYYGRAQLFRTPMMDLERAELLRGPQSILFGKNSIAGALNLTTAKPTEEFQAKLSVSHEFEHEQDELNAMVSGPLSDNLRARIAVRLYEEEGYFVNTYKNLDEPLAEEEAARISLEWTPTDALTFNFKAEKNKFETRGRAIEVTLDEPVDTGEPNEPDLTYAQWLEFLGEPTLESNLDYRRQADADERSDNQITNLTLTTNYELENDHTLTLVTGSLKYDYTEICDCDFGPASILVLPLFEDYEQFSQEIRLSSPLGRQFEWIGGLFYQDYDQVFIDDTIFDADSLLPRLSGLGPIANTVLNRDFDQSSEAWAVFGHLTWNVTDSLNVTLGARYTEEDKDASKSIFLTSTSTGAIITDPVAGFTYLQAFVVENEAATIDLSLNADGTPSATYGMPLENSGYNVSGSRSESALTPLVTVEYNISDDIMSYASYTTGFKAGGFDPRSNTVGKFALDRSERQVNPSLNFEFEDEKATAMELGVKSTLADGRGELNVALYRTDYDDLQISQFDGGVGFNVGNAKETRVQGIEVDGRWLFTEWLTASYGMSFLDFEYRDFSNGNCNVITAQPGSGEGTLDLDGDGDFELCDYTGKRGTYTPEYTVNLGFDFFFPLGDTLELVGFIDTQYVDSHNVHVNLDPAGEIDGYLMLNARIGVQTEDWSVSLLGKNLNDEAVISYSANAPLSDSNFETNTHYSFVRRPMTFALEAAVKF